MESSPVTIAPQLLRPKEVAARCGTSESYIYKRIEDGSLAVVRIGRGVRVLESDLADFIARNRSEAAIAV